MTQPSVIITELDGALGVLPPSAGKLLALVGAASAGPLNTPATFARVKDIQATFVTGPLVEAAARYVNRYSRPVVLVRTGALQDAAVSAVTAAKDATSVDATIAADPTPDDDLDLAVRIVAEGTIGTPGITYKVSDDGGRSYGAVMQLGVATSVEVRGVVFSFGAGTVKAGDTYKASATAAQWTSSELATALTALGESAVSWEQVQIVGAMDVAAKGVADTAIAGLAAKGKYHYWLGGPRMPGPAESPAAYLGAMQGVWGSSPRTVFGALCGGDCMMTSGVTGQTQRRPVAMVAGALQASVSEEVNIASTDFELVGVAIRDANGNPASHDESINPGLDDLGFITLRTWDGQGVYINRPRLFSPEGSDFQLVPHRRVLNIAHAALRSYFIRRTNKPILVDAQTGFILESEALEIEAGANEMLRAVLLAKPKASAAFLALSRTDNLLSTKTLTGQARVAPLAYPEFVALDVGFFNPALQVKAA